MTHKRHAPATLRNREPLLEVLRRVVPEHGRMLEVASGSGEHVAFFAERFPDLEFLPTDLDETALASIDAWCEDRKNVQSARVLDAASWPWPVISADCILCCNMIHIAPELACDGLLVGASRVLAPGGKLILYGPFREGGAHTAESNARFDEDLQRRNPSWGVRDLETVLARAAELGLMHTETVIMPAENRTVILTRAGSA